MWSYEYNLLNTNKSDIHSATVFQGMRHVIKKILWIKEREIECFVWKGK